MKQMLRSYREVLGVRTVRVVLLAVAVSVAGDAATMVALLLRVHAAGSGPWAVTALLLAFGLPVVATMGVAGSLADRADPRRVLVVTAAVQVGAAVGLAVVHGLVATFLLVLVLQTAFALGNPSWTAVVPRLVPDGAAGRVVALQQALRGVAGPLGAGVGGVLVQWRGPSAALLLDAATFLALGVAALVLPRTPAVAAVVEASRAAATATRASGRRLRGAVDAVGAALLPREGLAAMRADRVLGVLVLSLLPVVVTLESVNVVEVFLVRDVLGASSAQFGAVAAVEGAAAVLGAVLSGLASTRTARIRVVLAALALVGVVQVGEGLAPTYLVYLALGAGVGMLLGGVNALTMGLVLDEVPAERLGAAIALVGGLSRAAGALSLVLGGVVGSLAGPRATYVVAGSGCLLVALLAVLAVHRSVDHGSTGRASRPGPRPTTLEV